MRIQTVMKTSITRILQCSRCIRSNGKHVYPMIPCRGYATIPEKGKGKKFDLPDEFTEEVFHSLANNPAVMQAMHQVIEAFNSRGITLDKEPSVTEMWKIMKDKELVNALTTCIPLKMTND